MVSFVETLLNRTMAHTHKLKTGKRKASPK